MQKYMLPPDFDDVIFVGWNVTHPFVLFYKLGDISPIKSDVIKIVGSNDCVQPRRLTKW